MAKRKASGGLGDLGLGGYGSASESESQEVSFQPADEDEGNEPSPGVDLLGRYTSCNSLDSEAARASGSGDKGLRLEAKPDAVVEDGTAGEQQDVQIEEQAGPAEAADSGLVRLPPELRGPLPTTCSPELQAKFNKFLQAMQTSGQNINDSLRNRRDFSNPDFLQKLVQHFQVKEYGSAFNVDVFNPEGLSEDDTIESLLRALEREQERRARAREQAHASGQVPRIPFEKGTGALGHIPASNSAGNLVAAQAHAAAIAQAAARAIGTRR